MGFLLMLHSIVRGVILLVAVVAIIKFAVGWLRGSEFKGMDRGLMSGFSGLMDLQVMLGLILLLWSGFAGAGFPRYRLEHAVVMIIAAVVAHLNARWRNAENKVRFRNDLFIILATLVLILLGISVLPGGLSR
jgi:uncharacterized membrane protein YphA (DoxX/SURF4 family)